MAAILAVFPSANMRFGTPGPVNRQAQKQVKVLPSKRDQIDFSSAAIGYRIASPSAKTHSNDMRIGSHVLRNLLFVAPMAGVTVRSFRQLCKKFGAGMAVSE